MQYMFAFIHHKQSLQLDLGPPLSNLWFNVSVDNCHHHKTTYYCPNRFLPPRDGLMKPNQLLQSFLHANTCAAKVSCKHERHTICKRHLTAQPGGTGRRE